MSILSKGELRGFRNTTRTFSRSVNESLNEFKSERKQNKVTIFLSHKHDESEELDGAISLLKRFGVDVYVDWQDAGMPAHTNVTTATRIKEKIRENKKFIFLATEGAISSKWCNWELGYGDAQKYIDHLALLPIRNDGQNYNGSEYMRIYPSIEYLDGTTKATDGRNIPAGYYVMQPETNGVRIFITLKQWLSQ